MAKQTPIQMPAAGGGVLSKVIGAAIGIALVMVVVNHPADSADQLKGLVGAFMALVDGLSTFFHSLTS